MKKNYNSINEEKRVGVSLGCGSIFAFICAIFSFFWLLNLQMGIFFEIPDNLPVVGNLDEAFFTMLLLSSLSYLGIELPFLSGSHKKFEQRKRIDK